MNSEKRAKGPDGASILASFTYSWVYPFIRLAWSRELEERDAYSLLPDKHDSYRLAEDFDSVYKAQERPEFEIEGSSRGKKPPTTLLNFTTKALLRLWWPTLAMQLAWASLETGARLSAPVLLMYLLMYFTDVDAGLNPPSYNGWLYALGISLLSFVMLFHHILYYLGYRMGIQQRVQVTAAIHSKLLWLNSASISSISAGKVVNLVSNDARRFDDYSPHVPWIILAPIELGMILLMVSLKLGIVPAVSGVGIILMVVPVQGALVRFVAKTRTVTARWTDERVRLTSELIQGALAVKMLSWERLFSRQLGVMRSEEAACVLAMSRIRILNTAMLFVIGPLVSFVTFAVYRALGNTTLSVPVVFYCLALFQLPRTSMVIAFTLAIQSLTELMVSIQRIDDFLSTPEPPDRKGLDEAAAEEGFPSVEMDGSGFDWSRPMGGDVVAGPWGGTAAPEREAHERPPSPGLTLSGIAFKVKKGELLAICGEVGSGKSSVLAALLGELLPIKLELEEGARSPVGPVMRGSVGYCQQVPWIASGSIRDNVVFGAPWDPPRYGRVLAACALDVDLALLPAGDATELGERGINLSGGQKARIALARLCYLGPDVALMDDPLSAVDPRVGRVLFNDAIMGEMSGSTRVLVTHQRQYLPQCDRILVLRTGRVAALGTWQELSGLGLPELGGGGSGEPVHDVSVDEAVETVIRTGRNAAPDANLPLSGALPGPFLEPSSSPVHEEESVGDGGAVGSKPSDRRLLDSYQAPTGTLPITDGVANNSRGGQLLGDEPTATVVIQVEHISGLLSAGPDDIPMGRSVPGTSSAAAHNDVSPIGPLRTASSMGRAKSGWLTRERTFNFLTQRRQPDPIRVPTDAAPGGSAWFEEGREGCLEDGAAKRGLWSQLAKSFSSRLWLSKREKDGDAASLRVRSKSIQEAADVKSGRLVHREHRHEGDVPWAVYWSYVEKLGLPFSGGILLMLLGGQACSVASDWWLAMWSRADNQGDLKWVWVYGLLVGLVVLVAAPRSALFFIAAVQASTHIHDAMALRVLRAPLAFFHTNPVGRMLNRFSRDLGVIDDILPFTIFDALQCAMVVLGAFVLVCIAVPVILPVFVPLLVLFYYVRTRYIVCSRECKRWEAVSRSPVYAFFAQSIKGLPTIRSYGAGERFHKEFLDLISLNNSWCHAVIASARWVGFRLDLICALTLSATALLAVAAKDMVKPQLLGLALTYIMSLMGVMQWFVRQTAEVENNMTSLERLLEYTQIPQEPPLSGEAGAREPPPGWPRSGEITFDKVVATYRLGLPPVLREVSFHLPAGTSCGLVGRTGSGKSSLMLALFRLISVDAGRVLLDGVDVADIGLDSLRRQLAIIPQDPVLFSGTIRGNLDPWGMHPDSRIWEALGAVQLKRVVSELEGGLHARMAEAGDNLSVGQRQLFCLARALLQDARVLALDEATASVDRNTDALIQNAVRRFARTRLSSEQTCQFGAAAPRHDEDRPSSSSLSAVNVGPRVLLVIAHRIDTIIDMDRVLVLGQGRLMEEGDPRELARRQGGVFAGMVAASQAAASALSN